jgi:hypothetical protein
MPHKDPEAARAYRRRYYKKNRDRKWKNQDGSWKSRPKEKIREQRRRRYQEDPEFRARHLATQKAIRERSGRWKRSGTCPICKSVGVRLVWDHDHRTGKFRAWICGPCNLLLGHAKESPGTLLMAAAYLLDLPGTIAGETVLDVMRSTPRQG